MPHRFSLLLFAGLVTAGALFGTVIGLAGSGPVRAAPGDWSLSVDCNLSLAGVQDSCTYPAGTTALDAGVVLVNIGAGPRRIGAFSFDVVAQPQPVMDPTVPGSCTSPALDCNPDFNNAMGGSGWQCAPPTPIADRDEDPNVASSLISCINPNQDGQLMNTGDSLLLVTVHYSTANGDATLDLSEVQVTDEAANELMSCNPILETEGICAGATVSIGGLPPTATSTGTVTDTPTITQTPVFSFTPTHTPTDTPTNTPSPTATNTPILNIDLDGDGIIEDFDNCPGIANPMQENADENFIDQTPPKSVDDTTRANSDGMGDACDNDDDNDGLPDVVENGTLPLSACPSATGVLDPLNGDSDFDRVLDGAECQLGFDPTSSASKPPPIVMPDEDVDGVPDQLDPNPADPDSDDDGVRDGVEFRNYNTNMSLANTDNDVCGDAREIASINNDNVVNSGDQLLMITEILRLPPPAKVVNIDLNKDGSINSGDQLFMVKLIGPCP
ncbi:MAG: thrombospondin type 3 repeat-containing protein [Chloroflexi bacterium]|nr:thrombospondin type 3 repeat-containing protein [Chloroflexota bacterium]